MFDSTEDLVAYIKDNDVEVFDIRFCDLPGIMNHLTVPAGTVTVESLAAGMAFDGSSIKGFQSIHESDMTLLPDSATARIDPFRRRKTMTCNFFVHDPLTLASLLARPAQRRPQGRGVPGQHRDRRYLLLRCRGRVLRLRRRPLRRDPQRHVLLRSTPRRVGGTPGARSPAGTSATRPGSRAATSRSRRTTTTPIFART